MGSTKLCGWLGLLFVVSSIVSFIGFSDNASANTNTHVRVTDKLIVSGQEYTYQEIADTLQQQCETSTSGTTSLIVTNTDSPVGLESVMVYFADDPMELDFEDTAVYVNQTTRAYSIYDWGGLQCQDYGFSERTDVTTGQLFYDTHNIKVNYPEDYTGVLIPGVEVKESLYPHFNYLVTDKEIKAYADLTQELPDLPEPDEGWQNNEWQIMWYLFKCGTIDDDDYLTCDDREAVHSDLLLRDEEYTWEVDEYGDYLLIAEFRYQSCYRYASWPATDDHCILLSEHDEYSFVPGRTVYLPIDGMNIVGDTGNLNCDEAGYCYDDTRFKNCNVVVAIATLSFDDFNYADCLENITLLANMLSFDTIKFSNSWVSSGNCYTLGTLGNWLNLDNKNVCPYFSNEVRNTITPFITFMLGLIMIRFIAGKGSHGTMREDL